MSYNENGRRGTGVPQTANNKTIQTNSTTGRPIKLGRRTIGEVHDRVLVKHIRLSIHRFVKYDAVAYSVAGLDRAEELGALWAQFHDDDTGNVFHVAMAQIRCCGIPIPGDDRQLAMPLKQWHRGPAPTTAPESLPVQLALLEVAL